MAEKPRLCHSTGKGRAILASQHSKNTEKTELCLRRVPPLWPKTWLFEIGAVELARRIVYLIFKAGKRKSARMSTSLSPENEQYIQTAIAAGLYHDRAEILDRAVDLLKKREQLIRDVNLGIEQLEKGESELLDIEEIRAAVREKLKST
jgi:antitoxin ParD1/3/4